MIHALHRPRKVLFLDDDPWTLKALKRMLRGQRQSWDMSFFTDARLALTALQEDHFDVVVSDMHMPALSGADFLSQVKVLQPAAIRIIFSGYPEDNAAMKTVPIAHQFIAKPCKRAKIVNAIDRACNLRDVLDNPELRDILGDINTLPSLPSVYTRLTEALQDPNVETRDLAHVIEGDMAMSAKTLQLVNSAFFGLPNRILRIEDAIHMLGLETMKTLVLNVSVFEAFAHPNAKTQRFVEALQAHALMTAQIARSIFKSQLRDEASVAGITHQLGCLVLLKSFPERMDPWVNAVLTNTPPTEPDPLYHVQPELGGYLLGLWGLPHAIVEAVAYHQRPAQIEPDYFGLVTAVHVASALASEVLATPLGGSVDAELLLHQGMAAHLQGWRKVAYGIAGHDRCAG